MGKHIVDADAHVEAKQSGDYGTEAPVTTETPIDAVADPKPEAAEETESLISDVDPGDPEAGIEPVTAEAKEEETTEGDKEETEEGDKPEATDFTETFEGWTNEFMENGALSEESAQSAMDTVFKSDIPDEVKAQILETYQAGAVALSTAAQASAHELVGGQEAYVQMSTWAQEALPEAEQNAFDVEVTSGDLTRRDTAIKGLHARMQQALGSEPNFEPNLAHDGGRAAGEPIIGSRQELVKIYRTEEYKKDPAVRAKVARQLEQSMNTGKYIS
jgi:hypothetical protein